jgi:hypothetical protein
VSVSRTSAARTARGDEQRGRPQQHLAVDPRGEVDAEERQAAIRHRVDEAAHELAPLGRQREVPAAEGDDARIGIGAAARGEAIGPQAGAEHRAPALHRVVAGRAQADRASGRGDFRDVPAQPQLAARGADVVGQARTDRAEVDDPGARDM